MSIVSVVLFIVNLFLILPMQDQSEGWTPLLDKNLSQWESYIELPAHISYNYRRSQGFERHSHQTNRVEQ